MFTINGSVYTVGPDNKLPIDTLYDFKRYCHKFLLQNNTNNQEFIIKDDSPYSNYITYKFRKIAKGRLGVMKNIRHRNSFQSFREKYLIRIISSMAIPLSITDFCSK